MPTAVEVLASGGMDSAMLIHHYVLNGYDPRIHFIDYGQPAAESERDACRSLATRLALDWLEHRMEMEHVPHDGEIPGRNQAFLDSVADNVTPPSLIALGIHAGSPYWDTTPQFAHAAQRRLNARFGGAVVLDCPFIGLKKEDIARYARMNRIDLTSTYSCDVGDELHCGSCRSCDDRAAALRRPVGRLVRPLA